MACRLQEVRPRAPSVLAARMAQAIALTALAVLGLSGAPVHEPVHADGGQRPIAVTERSERNPPQRCRNLTTWSNRTGHPPVRCAAELSRTRSSGAAAQRRGPTSVPPLGLGRPARRTLGHHAQPLPDRSTCPPACRRMRYFALPRTTGPVAGRRVPGRQSPRSGVSSASDCVALQDRRFTSTHQSAGTYVPFG